MDIKKFFRVPEPNPMQYHFFYSVRGGDGYLSNFARYPFRELDIEFHSVEQYMHYHKAKLFNDDEIADQIMLADTPLETKRLGRKVHGFDDKVWGPNKKEIVKNGVRLKFVQNPALLKKLQTTRPKLLVEAAGGRNADRIWGIGYSASEAMDNIDNWGSNLLGKILTEIREEVEIE